MTPRLAVLTAVLALLIAAPPAAAAFETAVTKDTFGQAPDWLDDSSVVFHAAGPDGTNQIFASRLDGDGRRCLSCGLAGPNQVPVTQPGGDWVLFHSWNGSAVKVGSPGFGGLGSDLWVMTRDGRRRTRLTGGGPLRDNFHAYWSPDGRFLVWTSLNWNAAEGGNGKSDVRVGRFVVDARGPRLVGVHAVRPPNGHWYETQWWAPDGSGFLYTETWGTALNPELFFCRLDDPARGTCRTQRLTDDPAWDEQAIFTRSMDRIILMSTRDHAGAFGNWTLLARLIGLPASYDYALILPVFTESFLQPVFAQANDLYELPLRWNARRTRFAVDGAPRRLTRSGAAGWVIPEFALDPSGRRLLWTQLRLRGRVDEPTVLRRIRERIVASLQGIDQIGEVPFSIYDDVADQVGQVLRDPAAFTPARPPGLGNDARTIVATLDRR